MVTAKPPLTPEEHECVRAAVAAAESRSSALLALVIVPVSDRYTLYPLVWAALAALAATGALALVQPGLGITTGFVVDAAVFVVLALLLDWRPLRLLVVPRRVKQAHAHQLAHREFAARVLANTQHRNGVLFFVSLGERHVEVIADRDIHSRVASGTWERLVADFVAAAKAGRLAEGLVTGIESCAAVLENHYPRTGTTP